MEGTSIPVRRSRARTQTVANRIRQQILSGAWPDGRLMPSERDMAAQFGIARNTLRRIIRQLEAEGLIESHPGRGSVVRLSPLGEQMSRAEVVPVTAHARQADVLEMRSVLEPQVAELAASRASAEDISAMEVALQNAIEAKESGAFTHWCTELRRAIWRAAHNAALLAWYEAHVADHERPVAADLRSDYQREQAAIIAAVRNRDPALARELMRRHMTRQRTPPRPLAAVEA